MGLQLPESPVSKANSFLSVNLCSAKYILQNSVIRKRWGLAKNIALGKTGLQGMKGMYRGKTPSNELPSSREGFLAELRVSLVRCKEKRATLSWVKTTTLPFNAVHIVLKKRQKQVEMCVTHFLNNIIGFSSKY